MNMLAVVEQQDVEMEHTAEAALPVLLPDGGDDAASGVADLSRPDDAQGVLAAIRRLEIVIEEETQALRAGKKIDFDDFSARKSRSMLEFVRLMRTQLHPGGEAEIAEELQKLRGKLERNRAVLEMHYDAVREVAEIIVRAIREAESDGTYSARTPQESK
ncbi:flagellar biosynthesis protein FlgN [Bradyrhizobium sp. WSM 1704]|uniref:flagellar biosynthesis protein FlgN n=1 Tax=Bradyrhizobium semiaridum TaxID=2821404 RepID=UPI001CE2FFD4|nr:flagellar biosynthesis protein FlgN [Bradyrhizobium semiaridum]MCA6123810.1 flagellar biosynthesis protein FlgN [Bradyrhizobium semiaridum]